MVEKSSTDDVETLRAEWWTERTGTQHRPSCTSSYGRREWVVRRRSDGSRYIGRRRSTDNGYRHHHADPARQSQSRSASHHRPADYVHPAGHDVRRATDGDVIRTPTAVDQSDYGTVEWICSPQWTASSYRIFAII